MRIYLDNSATSWPKPEPVYAAVDHYQREIGIAAGRGSYGDAVTAARIVEAARRELAALLGAPNPRHIVFGGNGTDALNLAIHGVLRPGDHVVASVTDHNSVLRPLAEEARTRDVTTTFVPADSTGVIDPQDVERAITPRTRLVIITHSSNVTGAVQPVAEIAAIAKSHGAMTLIDASQSAGHVPIDVAAWGVDLLAASGHKGLLGPAGTGLLYIREGAQKDVRPIRQGGTGVESQLDRQPDELPTRYESGSLNGPGLAGLAAAAKYLREQTIEAVAAHERRLIRRLCDGLTSIKPVRVYGPSPELAHAPVVSFSVEGYDPQDFAAVLDSTFGIQCRAGLHCAPRMHASLGTLQSGGLVRLSLGWFTSAEQIDQTLAAIEAIASTA